MYVNSLQEVFKMQNSVLQWLNNAAELYGSKVIFNDTKCKLTFDEFNNLTKAIGSFLLDYISSNEPVAVMCSRNVYAPACYLGVTRGGGIYAPIDGTMPKNRINKMLSVINSKYMIVDKENYTTALELNFHGDIFLLEDIISANVRDEDLTIVEKAITGTTPLYIIFTSGSTGVPKGVVTSHYSLMCYIEDFCECVKINKDTVLGNQSPLDYIASIRDIFIPIKTGASTVIIPKNEFALPVKLFDTLNEYKVTTLCWSVAGMEIPVKLKAFNSLKPLYLKNIVFSGSVMSGKCLKVWQQNLPDVQFINQYGPTEATASCTYYKVKENVNDNTVLPIGKPYKNYKVFLLNKDNTLTENGEVGEICVSGPCVALGYYGNLDLTNKSFIQNPLNNSYKEIIYKTGDLGRLAPNGNLEYIGRLDRQIKHMGHRIELEEIEKIASELQGVVHTAAIYDKEKSILCLFYTGSPKIKDVIIYFRKTVPAFMVPRKVIKLESMPLLPNGKTDFNTLNLNLERGL
jgi:amino acid adenylation domain-containing protein